MSKDVDVPALGGERENHGVLGNDSLSLFPEGVECGSGIIKTGQPVSV